jgi:hypothetical protein
MVAGAEVAVGVIAVIKHINASCELKGKISKYKLKAIKILASTIQSVFL